MAQIKITLSISIEEANLILKVLQEGEDNKQLQGRQLIQETKKNPKGSREWEQGMAQYQLLGQEILAIEAIRRGMVKAL